MLNIPQVVESRLNARAWLAITLGVSLVACGSDSPETAGIMAAGPTPPGMDAVQQPSVANDMASAPVADVVPAETTAQPGAVPDGAAPMGAAGQVAGSTPDGSDGQAPMAGTAGSVPAEGSVPPVTGGAAAENTWPMMAYDVQSTYFNSQETILTKENAANLQVAWRANMGTNVYGAPLQVGGVIYGSVSGLSEGQAKTSAFDAATGEEKWSITDYGTTGSMAYDDGRLYMHTIKGELVALDAATGAKVYTQALKGTDGSASPILYGDHVFLGGSNGEFTSGNMFKGFVASYSKADGAEVAIAYTVDGEAHGANVWSTLALDPAGGLVIATTGNNHGPPATDTSDAFLGYSMDSITLLWKNQRVAEDTWSLGLTDITKPDADFGANPMLYDTEVNGVMTPMVSAGAKSGDIHGVNRMSGELIWTRSLCPQTSPDGTTGVFVNTSWSGSSVLAACNKGTAATLFALAPDTGDILWMTELDGLVMGRISAANGVGFVGAGSNMVIFDTDSGSVIKKVPAENGTATVTGTVSIVDGRVAYGEGMGWMGTNPGTTLTVLSVQ